MAEGERRRRVLGSPIDVLMRQDPDLDAEDARRALLDAIARETPRKEPAR